MSPPNRFSVLAWPALASHSPSAFYCFLASFPCLLSLLSLPVHIDPFLSGLEPHSTWLTGWQTVRKPFGMGHPFFSLGLKLHEGLLGAKRPMITGMLDIGNPPRPAL